MTYELSKTCCFTGHRYISGDKWLDIENKTYKICEELTERGFCNFITGGALGFDTMAALCVLRLRQKHKNIKLTVAVPCRNQSEKWHDADQKTYNEILKMADEVKVLSEEYTPECMHRRNRFMVDNSGVCVAYMKKVAGGTAYTVRYAVDNDREVIFVG